MYFYLSMNKDSIIIITKQKEFSDSLEERQTIRSDTNPKYLLNSSKNYEKCTNVN